MEDIDLKVLVTRADLEGIIADLVERCTQPISDALVAAGMDKTAIDQLVLVGGSTRVPIVQEKIQVFMHFQEKIFSGENSGIYASPTSWDRYCDRQLISWL